MNVIAIHRFYYCRHHASAGAIKVTVGTFNAASTWFPPDNTVNVGFTLDYGCIFRINSIRITNTFKDAVGNRLVTLATLILIRIMLKIFHS